jgi:hypothetical protein
MNIWDTLKTLKYLNINENQKYVCRLKYIILYFLIVVLFGFVNIKSVKKILKKTTAADENVLYKRIHSRLQIL